MKKFFNFLILTRKIEKRINLDLSAIQFVVIVSLANMIIYNIPLYWFAITNLGDFSVSSTLTLITLLVLIFTLTSLAIATLLIFSQYASKIFCVIVALTNSVALYFIVTYQVILDRSMMGSILNTNFLEAANYLHQKLIIYIFVFGFIPVWILLKIRIQKINRVRVILYTATHALAFLCWVYLSSSTWLWFDKNAKKLGALILPWSYITNTVRHQSRQSKALKKQELLPDLTFKNNDKMLVILVIGEAARSKNFSLYGYGRPTNPLLAKAHVIALNNPLSCSTYTTKSVACMLSHNTGLESFENYEPLPNYLYRQGVDVIWRTNNWGEPPLRVRSYQRRHDLLKECKDCEHDEILLSGLTELIKSSSRKKVFVVLHQTGSHGPSYYKKYPKRFEVFKPVCKSVNLDQCTNQELVNAYDNTILYTDYFLNKVIGLLKSFKGRPTLLIYASDHGESLGEHGLYLHGTPFLIAPDVQKNIPFIVWMSDKFSNKKDLSKTKFKQGSKHAHENIFHSIMGAFDLDSSAYNKKLDIFKKDEK